MTWLYWVVVVFLVVAEVWLFLRLATEMDEIKAHLKARSYLYPMGTTVSYIDEWQQKTQQRIRKEKGGV